MIKLAITLATILCMGTSHAFQVIRGDQQPDILQLQFANYLDLFPFTARFGESVIAPLLTGTQTAIVQHGVNVLLDCGALIPETGKPLGSGGVQWEVNKFVRDHNGVFSVRNEGTESGGFFWPNRWPESECILMTGGSHTTLPG